MLNIQSPQLTIVLLIQNSSVVDFNVSAEGTEKWLCNSFRLVGKLNAYSTGTTRVVNTDDINYDGRIGVGWCYRKYPN